MQASTVATASRQNVTLTVAILGWMFDGFEMGLFPLVARSALVDLLGSVGDGLVGLWVARITALFLLGAALGGIGFGWLGDRIGRNRALALSILTYALGTALCFWAKTPAQLGFLRFLAALGMGGEWALGVALVMETWSTEQRTIIAGFIGAASHIGFVLVGCLGLIVPVTPDSWRTLMLFGVAPALLTFFIRLYIPESPRWQQCEQNTKPLSTVFSKPYRFITIVSILLATVVHIGTWGVVYWAPIWADQMTAGVAPLAKALTQIVCALGAAVGGFSGALIGERLDRRKSYALSSMLSLISCLTLFLSVSTFDAPFLLLMFWVGFSTGTFYGWLALFLPTFFPTAIRATGQGIAFNAGRLVAIFGVMFTGQMVHALDGSYRYAGALTSLIYAVGIFTILLLPTSLHHNHLD